MRIRWRWLDSSLRVWLAVCLSTGMTSPAAWAATYHVNPEQGDDARSATQAQDPSTPWKTLTQALSVASSGDMVQLDAGLYYEGSGETFPLPLKDGVKVVGSGPETVVEVWSGAAFDSQGRSLGEDTWLSNLTIDGTEQVAQITDEGTSGVRFSVESDAQIAMHVDNVGFGPMLNVGVDMAYDSGALEMRPVLENNAFNSSYGIDFTGYFYDPGELAPQCSLNDFIGNNEAIRLYAVGNATDVSLSPLISANTFAEGENGIYTALFGDFEAVGQATFSPTIENNSFTGMSGTAISLQATELSMVRLQSDLTVSGNTATEQGGGFLRATLSSGTGVEVDANWNITGNSATSGDPYSYNTGIFVDLDDLEQSEGQFRVITSSNTITDYLIGLELSVTSIDQSRVDVTYEANENILNRSVLGEGNTSGIQVWSGESSDSYMAQNFTVSGNTISGYDYGIEISVTSLSTGYYDIAANIEDNDIRDGRQMGAYVYLYDMDSARVNADVTIRNNTVSNMGWTGIAVTHSSFSSGMATLKTTIADNTISQVEGHGIYLYAYSASDGFDMETTVSGNSISNIGRSGIVQSITSMSSAVGNIKMAIEGNQISDASDFGIYAYLYDWENSPLNLDFLIKGNTITRTYNDGIAFTMSSFSDQAGDMNVEISENSIQASGDYGLYLGLFDWSGASADLTTTIMHNNLDQISRVGIGVDTYNFSSFVGDLTQTVAGNTVSKADTGVAMSMWSMSDNNANIMQVLAGNIISQSQDMGAELNLHYFYGGRGDLGVMVAGNTITSSSNTGLFLGMSSTAGYMRHQTIDVMGNVVTASAGDGLELALGGERAALSSMTRVADNILQDNASAGLRASATGFGVPTMLVTANTITDNGEAGYVQAGANSSSSPMRSMEPQPADLGGGLLASPGNNILTGNGGLIPRNYVQETGVPAFARHNHWGSNLSAVIDAGIIDDDESMYLGAVDFGDSLSDPPDVALTGSFTASRAVDTAPTGNSQGDTFAYSATVQNTGDLGCATASMMITAAETAHVMPGSVVVSRGMVHLSDSSIHVALGSIGAGETVEVSWQAMPGVESCAPLTTAVVVSCAQVGELGLSAVSGNGVDNPANINLNSTYYLDMDGDGFGGSTSTTTCTEPAAGYYPLNQDCNDEDAAVNPDADELIGDGVDQDCDGTEVCYLDADGDGFRPDELSTVPSENTSCSDAMEATWAAPYGDCNDADDQVNPSAIEQCDLVDDDCDGDLVGTDTDDDLDMVPDCAQDTDLDGLDNISDNCPYVENLEQDDLDDDGIGDACDMDKDGDGLLFGEDCDDLDDSDTADMDDDGIGDTCDMDADGDGVPVGVDCDDADDKDTADMDDDGIGDACDMDADGDGVPMGVDCDDADDKDTADMDDDGIGDACDTDKDGDGYDATVDCNDDDKDASGPNTFYADKDGDNIGDGADWVQTCSDTAPTGYVATKGDNCPADTNADQADADSDGWGDACDVEATPTGTLEGGAGGCSTNPSGEPMGIAAWMAALALLPLVRRRRQA